MFKFYQKMLNDTQLPLLALDSERVGIVYATWSESEAILSAIDEESLKQICLSRIDDLSRRMINNIATQEK
ncbi:hypothetical protein [Psychromonas sp. psych-6C06]|uniref:hypothetical protein n=1 Tax=Psychromonas sp. psych-6C06 TaxID=2058089 RepID=UPI0012907490|nr:hypothetical protein [Psychromonas sp. psych-6C06]